MHIFNNMVCPCHREAFSGEILKARKIIIAILKQFESVDNHRLLFEMAHLIILHVIFLLLNPFAAHLNPLQLLLVDAAPQLDDLADSGAFTTSSLELKVGLNLSVANAFNKTSQLPISSNNMFSIAIPGFNVSWFLPIISSPSFNSSNASERRGFSFGFVIQVLPVPSQQEDSINVYLGVCGGVSGNYLTNVSNPLSAEGRATLRGSADSRTLYAPTVLDGAAVLVWRINPSTPLTSYGAYLQVVENNNNNMPTTNSNQLELRDYNGNLVWNVSNVGLMEIQDSGTLLIYDNIDKSQVVWKSGARDTLFLREKLEVGEQLTSSSDSSYSLRMEQGGLVLYLNTMQFMDEHPAPYWAIPILNLTLNAMNISKQVFFSSPCNNEAAYAKLESSIFFGLEHSFGFVLDPGTCRNSTLGINTKHSASPTDIAGAGPMSFVKLEDDGWLHSYAVSPTGISSTSHTLSGKLLPNWDSFFYFDTRQPGSSSSSTSVSILQVSQMNITCAVPNHCGPLGLCTPFANCTCPPSFTAIDNSNANAGCVRITLLPDCTKDEHVDTTEYVSLNHTATSFLFSGWTFASTSGKVELCKMSCSANCSCSGFFYQAHTFSCFFITITNEMSLLNTLNLKTNGFLDIQPSNYVTYLKVTSDQINTLQASSSPPSGHAKSSTVIAITVVSSLAVCLGIGLAVHVFHSRARVHSNLRERAVQAAELEEELRDVIPLLPSRFSYQDLYQATEGFSKLLGAGASGSVYFGMLEDRRKVAVKTLESIMKGDQSKQFLAEVATIGQTSHQNVVRLIGFCWEVSSRSLVYEYMGRGSLDHWLFVKPGTSAHDEGAPLLDWQTRYRVVLGIARGLRYLHEECPQPILHFDIKPQNILLDDYFVPKLADFGLSRLMQKDISRVITGIRGTPGYIAPEWVLQGEVSKKSDVYSMGMVMLEIVGGRRNLDLELRLNCDNSSGRHREEWYFPSWAAGRCEQGLEMELVDNRLQGAFEMHQARRLIYTAFWCIQEDPEIRPYVPTVVQWLEGISPVQQPPFSGAANSTYSRSKRSLDCCSTDFRPSSFEHSSFTAGSSSLL